MKKINLSNLLDIIFPIFCILIVVGFIAFEIYIWIEYGDKPASEVPSWVWWWKLGGKKN